MLVPINYYISFLKLRSKAKLKLWTWQIFQSYIGIHNGSYFLTLILCTDNVTWPFRHTERLVIKLLSKVNNIVLFDYFHVALPACSVMNKGSYMHGWSMVNNIKWKLWWFQCYINHTTQHSHHGNQCYNSREKWILLVHVCVCMH